MKKQLFPFVIILMSALSVQGVPSAYPEDEYREEGDLVSIGGSQYLEPDGAIVQMDDLGDGEFMTEAGSPFQADDAGDGEYITNSGEAIYTEND